MNIFKPLAIWMLALLASPALAGFGGQDGGGGGVIRCEKADNGSIFISRMVKGKRQFFKLPSPTSLSHNREYQFLDLWEAEVGSGPFFNHRVQLPFDQRATKEYWISRALSRLGEVDPELARQTEKYLTYIRERMFPAPEGNYVLGPDDTDIRFLPKGCLPPIGLGLYSDREDNLIYDKAIMGKLLVIDQAAFEIHEAIYKYLRVSAGARSSWQTRRIVGLIFSDEKFTKAELASDFKW